MSCRKDRRVTGLWWSAEGHGSGHGPQTRQFLVAARRNEHPDRWTESIVVAEGDIVVQFGRRELQWPGGPFRGFDLAAGVCTRDVAFAYRLRDARITERWAIRDDLAMLQQLGAIT
jgi:predicted ester cyclase